ncbi:MAG: hypothetical protein GY803_18480 [Chloroflexi bacterium]|nr:hypothetical protein [Chloroflexota bacterium]
MASGKRLSRHFFLLLIPYFLLLSACGNNRVVLDSPDILFHDEFVAGETGAWLVEGDDLGSTAVLNEQLVISIEEPNLLQYAALEAPLFSDFVLEVDATQLAGDLESSYGILFRKNGDQFYRFNITGSGLFVMERHNADGTWTRFFEDWRDALAVKQGLGATNRLKVTARGGDLSFYVNDQLLQQVNDGSYADGQIALVAGTFGQPGLQVAFDNVVVRKP